MLQVVKTVKKECLNCESGFPVLNYILIAAVLSVVAVATISANGSSLSSLIGHAMVEVNTICTS